MLVLKDLNLGYPTWLFLLGWAVKTVMPFTKGNQVVILHALVGLGKTQDESNHGRPRLKVVARVYQQVALVHPNDIVPGEVQSHLLVESIYVTQDSK